MRTLFTTLVLLCLAVPTYAQDTYIGAIFGPSVSAAEWADAVVPPVTFKAGSTPCDRPKLVCPCVLGPKSGTVEVRFNNPADSNFDCEVSLSLVQVPPGSGYRVALQRQDVTGRSVWSAFSPAFARQAAHECDSTPVSPGTMTAGQSVTVGFCHSGTDATGTSPVTSWRVYRNGPLLPGVPVTAGATANAEGLRYYTFQRTESAAGAVTYEVDAVNAVGPSATRLTLPAITVQAAATVPAAPSRGRITVP